MVSREDLKKYFDEKEVKNELVQMITQISQLSPDASDIITT